jgi:1-acyl-sn-glycerol-3-phosphate acyltransferase
MKMKYTFFETPVLKTILRIFSIYYLKLIGWKVIGALPVDTPKYVVIAAPHTSNWDMPMTLMCTFALRAKMHWMGKSSIFKWPFKTIMMWMGGIPIDRTKSNNIVDETIKLFNEHDELIITVPPEGTRKKAERWKTGFYHIARGAGVPIVCAFLDYKNKECGVGLTLMPTGDLEADMDKIKSFYNTKTGKYSHYYTSE